jgi:Uma2 family endonuclease
MPHACTSAVTNARRPLRILGHAELRLRAEETHSMAMPHTTWPRQGEWTVADVLALPEDGRRHELLAGELIVTPAPDPRHQTAVEVLGDVLARYLADRGGIGFLYRVAADLQFDGASLVQPDLFIVPFGAGRRPRDWREVRHLRLAIEVLSPSSARRDRHEKRRLYQEHADEYWVVDLDARVIERWRPGDERAEVVDVSLEWLPEGAGAPLLLDLPAFFREVLEA